MKTIPDYMDLSVPAVDGGGDPCVSSLHRLMQEADTATTRAEVDQSATRLLRIQGKCCELIYRLSVQEEIHRDCKDSDDTEFVEEHYSDLIQFIAGVGSACGDAVKRLDGFDTVETEELMAASANRFANS
ncbi:hypothetical protein ACUNV4_10390 [Granulosicoccus sp. 3-233]|uniref:hypothetical protein n=1 Tax=Granulosicoccus sp. 3-233 TaxID=3417969 RepID=UPI003D32B121